MKTVFNYNSLEEFSDAVVFSEIFYNIKHDVKNQAPNVENCSLISFFAKASGSTTFFEAISYCVMFAESNGNDFQIVLNDIMNKISDGKYSKAMEIKFIEGSFSGLKSMKACDIHVSFVETWLKRKKEVQNGN